MNEQLWNLLAIDKLTRCLFFTFYFTFLHRCLTRFCDVRYFIYNVMSFNIMNEQLWNWLAMDKLTQCRSYRFSTWRRRFLTVNTSTLTKKCQFVVDFICLLLNLHRHHWRQRMYIYQVFYLFICKSSFFRYHTVLLFILLHAINSFWRLFNSDKLDPQWGLLFICMSSKIVDVICLLLNSHRNHWREQMLICQVFLLFMCKSSFFRHYTVLLLHAIDNCWFWLSLWYLQTLLNVYFILTNLTHNEALYSFVILCISSFCPSSPIPCLNYRILLDQSHHCEMT